MHRGILGVRKDPKQQMLFSFNVREGDEMGTDSEDSDYEPSDDEAASVGLSKSKNKRKKKDSKEKKKKVHFDVADEKVSSSSKHSTWAHLPEIVLLKVFRYVVHEEGALPFLCRAARVCSSWENLASHPSLWIKIDLSYGWIKSKVETLQWLCQNRFSKTTDLNLSSWKCLENNSVKIISEKCSALNSVSLAYCKKVNAEGIKILLGNYLLESADFSFMSTDAMSPATLKYLTEERGKRLKHLNLSGNTFKGFNATLNSLSSHCPTLETLDVSNCIFSTDYLTFNIEKIQLGCPNIRCLRLANSRIRAPYASGRLQAESPGFPKLQELSVAASADGRNTFAALDNDCLYRILKSSYDLKLLDLRSCNSISAEGIHRLPITDLKHLFLFQSSVAKYSGVEVIMAKWQHSLIEVDLSWNQFPEESFTSALDKLSADCSTSKLEQLNLSGTAVCASSVGSLLNGCPNLVSLNLTSCRGLARGIKREYKGKALSELKRSIDSILDDSEEEIIVRKSKPRKAAKIEIHYSDSE